MIIRFFVFLGLLSLTGPSLHAQSALRAGFVESADVFLFVNTREMNQSAFSEAVEAQQPDATRELAEAKAAAFTEATGLEEDDLLAIVFSMDIDEMDFESQDPAQLENVQAVLAVELAESVTLEQVKDGLATIGSDTEGPKPEMTLGEEEGLNVLILTGTESPGGVDKAYGALSPDGKTVLMSFNIPSLKAGLARLESGEAAAPGEDMAAATQALGKRQVRSVLVLPQTARAKIQEGIAAAAAQGGMGAMLAPFATMKSLLVSANASDSLDLSLSLDLGDPGNAQQAAGMVQSMLPMMMMGMQEQLGPNAAAIAQKIRIAPEGNVVSVSLTLTADDVNMMPANGGAGGQSATEME